jgi:HK97 gp10 family phage protein
MELFGLDEVTARLELAVAAMAGPAADLTVKQVAAKVEDTMKADAPVLTGELRDSIHSVDDGHAAVLIEADSPHAIFNEFGTVHMAAHPFMRPALHEGESELPEVARVVYLATVPGLSPGL